jgi:hypothetical protein
MLERKAIYLMVAFLMVSLLIGGMAVSQKRVGMTVQAYIVPSKCDCLGEHGDVYIILRRGHIVSRQRLTKNGLCSDAKVAPNGQIVGWLEGDHVPRAGDPPEEFSTSALVLYKITKIDPPTLRGKILRRIEVGMNASWQFWNNARQVAVSSSVVLHSEPSDISYALYDINTGKLIARWNGKGKLPAWARNLLP